VTRRLLVRAVLGGALVALLLAPSFAMIEHGDTGMWPEDWPAALEPFRAQAKTTVYDGQGATVYEIPFAKFEEFQEAWDAVLEVKSPGGTLTLRRLGDKEPDWPFLLKDQPCVRIYAPTVCYMTAPRPGTEAEPEESATIEDMQAKVEAGEALRAGPPWPESAYLPNGELSEYVSGQWVGDRMAWVPATLDGETRGFLCRARVDIELVVDGEIVDLNRVPLPADTRIIDKRGLGPAG